MAKTKKLVVKQPSEPERIKSSMQKQIGCINDELQRIKSKLENTELNIDPEIDAIGDSLEMIASDVYETIDEYDNLRLEKEEVEKAKQELQSEFDHMEEQTRLTEFSMTMVGELKYETNNLLDTDIMERFTECLAEIQPATMIENLKIMKQYKTVI